MNDVPSSFGYTYFYKVFASFILKVEPKKEVLTKKLICFRKENKHKNENVYIERQRVREQRRKTEKGKLKFSMSLVSSLHSMIKVHFFIINVVLYLIYCIYVGRYILYFIFFVPFFLFGCFIPKVPKAAI